MDPCWRRRLRTLPNHGSSRRPAAQHGLPRQLIEPGQRALSVRIQPPLPARAARWPADAERMHAAKPDLAPCRRPRQPSGHAGDMTFRRGDDIAERRAAPFEVFRIEYRRRRAGRSCWRRVVQEAQGPLRLIKREERDFPCHPGIFALSKISGTQPRAVRPRTVWVPDKGLRAFRDDRTRGRLRLCNFHNRPCRAGTRLQHQPAPHQALGEPCQMQDLPTLLRVRPQPAQAHLQQANQLANHGPGALQSGEVSIHHGAEYGRARTRSD